MRPRLILSLCCLLLASPVLAQSDRTITVHGTAEVRVPPDQVEVSISVGVEGVELAPTLSQDDERTRKILALVPSFGMDSGDVQTDNVSVARTYKEEARTHPSGYSVSRSIVFTLRNVAKLESFLRSLAAAGITEVESVEFGLSHPRAAADKARALAVAAALQKAGDLATLAHEHLGPVRTLQEDRSTSSIMQESLNTSRYEGSYPVDFTDATTAPGSVAVSASVTLTCDLQP